MKFSTKRRQKRRLPQRLLFFLIGSCVLYQFLHPVSLRSESTSTAPRIRISRNNCTTTKTRQQQGIVILNTLGRLGNNLIQVAFAQYIASKLCWNVVLYRPLWSGELPSQRGYECFPHVGMPRNYREFQLHESNNKILNKKQWKAMTTEWSSRERKRVKTGPFRLTKDSRNYYSEWLQEQEEAGLAISLTNGQLDRDGNGVDELLTEIQKETSKVQIVSIGGFFIHYNWMHPVMNEIREMLAMNDACCFHTPPDDAVVIHIRDFGGTSATTEGAIQPAVYTEILKQYNLIDRPLWILCQPASVDSDVVQAIVKASVTTKIVTGRDQYDAFCTLTRAKTLLLSAGSTFSQMGALLADPTTTEVHMPIPRLNDPSVTLKVPGWKYHLVNESLDAVVEFDVAHERLHVTLA